MYRTLEKHEHLLFGVQSAEDSPHDLENLQRKVTTNSDDRTLGKQEHLLFGVQSAEDYPYDLGNFQRKVTTKSDICQLWFNRGLAWGYGFNQEEAGKCFIRAIHADPDCAMAHWGLAYVIGPNYNWPWSRFTPERLKSTVKRTYHAVRVAKQKYVSATKVEQLLIDALMLRYQQPTPLDDNDYNKWNSDYADKMKIVYESYPDDFDVVALYADALLNVTPWKLWDLKTGNPAPGSRAREAKAALELALKKEGGIAHPAVNHMYIHLMEMSFTPEAALPASDRLLSGMIPDAGHLYHMGSHIYVQIGDYRSAVSANVQACLKDEKFYKRDGKMNAYSYYRIHDYHFLVYSAMFAGQYKVAMDACTRMEASVSDELLRNSDVKPINFYLDGYLSSRAHALIRFGKWQEILDLRFPEDRVLYIVTTTATHYARTIAYAVTGEIDKAEQEKKLFHESWNLIPDDKTMYLNPVKPIYEIAWEMINGELEYRKKNFEVAFEHLQNAIKLDDDLVYMEPWGWMQPTRHAYAALMLEQGYVKTAAEVYKADLGLNDTLTRVRRHPNNVWALKGYYECLVKLGEGKSAEGVIIEQQLNYALAAADVEINSSCFCSLKKGVQTTFDKKSCCAPVLSVKVVENPLGAKELGFTIEAKGF